MTDTIYARDFWPMDDSQVVSAARIAESANEALRTHQTVRILMDDVLGAASSFFNVILLDVAAEHGPEAIATRLEFTFCVPSQETVFRRSLEAVLKQVR